MTAVSDFFFRFIRGPKETFWDTFCHSNSAPC